MYLGLDVGGTHTDAVLLDDHGIVSFFKTVTDHDNLPASIMGALEAVTAGIDRARVRRVNLSTTLSTNAIVEHKTEPVGVLITAGPGIDPQSLAVGECFHVIPGSIDHRGTETAPLDRAALKRAREQCAERGIRAFAAVGKFSTRNPAHEEQIMAALEGAADVVTMGHRLSGQLSFPRRVNTAYFNAAVWRTAEAFAAAMESSLAALGITAPINILKADGGTMPLAFSRLVPVESILSGPAASIMGIVALCRITEDAVILDIGGTTTDIALFAGGAPLVERGGIVLDGRATLVRALQTSSIGIGGDSAIHIDGAAVTVGPDRRGPSMAEGGRTPTLLDALNCRGEASHGDVGASRRGIASLAQKHERNADELAGAALAFALDRIHAAVQHLLDEINNRPVYTIHEMLEGHRLAPTRLYLMGGPAGALAEPLVKRFGLPSTVPEHFTVANAIGAALSRTTMEIELFADTAKGRLMIPALEVAASIDQRYTIEDARRDAREHLARHLAAIGAGVGADDAEITEESSFAMVEGYRRTGRDIRVKCQIKPAVERHLHG